MSNEIKKIVGQSFVINSTGDSVLIDSYSASEYGRSVYSDKASQNMKRHKTNASPYIGKIINVAQYDSHDNDDHNDRRGHGSRTAGGFNYYTTRFALPIVDRSKDITGYNTYEARLVVGVGNKGLVLHDLDEIRAGTGFYSTVNAIGNPEPAQNNNTTPDEDVKSSAPVAQQISSAKTSIRQIPALLLNDTPFLTSHSSQDYVMVAYYEDKNFSHVVVLTVDMNNVVKRVETMDVTDLLHGVNDYGMFETETDRESKRSLFYQASPSEQSSSSAEIKAPLYLSIENFLNIVNEYQPSILC